jgi:hypothetical protein
MPVKITNLEDRGIIIEGSGVLTDNDLIELHKEVYQTDERIKEISYIIFDVTNIEKNEVTNKQVINNAELDKRALNINPNMRLAILTKTNFRVF